jgi:hypothetical protein
VRRDRRLQSVIHSREDSPTVQLQVPPPAHQQPSPSIMEELFNTFFPDMEQQSDAGASTSAAGMITHTLVAPLFLVVIREGGVYPESARSTSHPLHAAKLGCSSRRYRKGSVLLKKAFPAPLGFVPGCAAFLGIAAYLCDFDTSTVENFSSTFATQCNLFIVPILFTRKISGREFYV